MQQRSATHDVIIIGAGASGLAAASTLAAAGLRVALLEARDRIGGRVFTVGAGPLPVELGAEFVDVPGPAAAALRRAGGQPVRSAGGMWHVTAGAATPLDVNGIAERVLGRLEQAPRSDPPFREWLAEQKGVSEADAEWTLRYVEGFHAADLDRVSVRWLAQTTGEDGGGGGAVRHTALGGFARAMQGLLRRDVDLCLNCRVREIGWSRGFVTVDCGSATVSARAVIVTLPLGVLQVGPDRGGVAFSPDIPRTLAAARALESGSVIKIVFRFRSEFWNERVEFAGADDTRERKMLMSDDVIPTWWTPSPVAAPLLTAWAGGGAALRLRRHADVIDVALDSLARTFGMKRGEIDAELEESFHHDWDADPLARGAYSYVPAGALDAQAWLRRQIQNTIYFAGEATAAGGWNATVDGAIESGVRAAEEVLASGQRWQVAAAPRPAVRRGSRRRRQRETDSAQ